MKKHYISDAIGVDKYGSWLRGKKVIINAPTGTGKTTFILTELLPYCKSLHKRMLILCNRRLLKQQYGFELAGKYERYAEMAADVDIMTYQGLAESMRDYNIMKDCLNTYDVIVCDEVHYFYADSDFNPEGTYMLWQKLVMACFFKTVIMITATLPEVLPLIEKTFKSYTNRLVREDGKFPGFEKYEYEGEIYDFQGWADYEHFFCYYIPDEETLAAELAQSQKKSLIFIDDKYKAEIFKKLLIKTGNVGEKDIYILNAEVMEEKLEDEVIQSLAVAHRIIPRILITTSVLDNGVSIHDADVGNVVIATDSRISFLQMIGRIRVESVESCRLFIFPREIKYFGKRVQQYEEKVRWFEKLSGRVLHDRHLQILQKGWFGKDAEAEFLRTAVVVTTEKDEYYGEEQKDVYIRFTGAILSVNEFAKEKVGNMLLAEKKFYRRCMEGPEHVALEQISWLGKGEKDLEVMDSTYKAEREKCLKNELLSIQNFSLDELREKKAYLAKEFRRDLLKGVIYKNESFSTEKLEDILRKFGLRLEESIGEDKRKRYTVKEA